MLFSLLATACRRGFLFYDGNYYRLTVQKKDKERISVFLDGEFAFGLAMSVAAADLRLGSS